MLKSREQYIWDHWVKVQDVLDRYIWRTVRLVPGTKTPHIVQVWDPKRPAERRTVTKVGDNRICDCPSFKTNRKNCKHTDAVNVRYQDISK